MNITLNDLKEAGAPPALRAKISLVGGKVFGKYLPEDAPILLSDIWLYRGTTIEDILWIMANVRPDDLPYDLALWRYDYTNAPCLYDHSTGKLAQTLRHQRKLLKVLSGEENWGGGF